MRIDRDDDATGAVIFRLHGHLDQRTYASVCAAVRQALDGGQPKIVLDLSDVAYVTSSGLSALMALYGRARLLGGDLVVLTAPPHLQVMLEVLRLTEVCLADELGDALAHLSAIPQALPADGTDGQGLLPQA